MAPRLLLFLFFFLFAASLSGPASAAKGEPFLWRYSGQIQTIQNAARGETAFFHSCDCEKKPDQLDPRNDGVRRALRLELERSGSRLYVVVDGAYDQGLVRRLKAWKEEPLDHRSLFAGTPMEKLSSVAPYLVEVEPDFLFLDGLLGQQSKARAKTLFIVSYATADALISHLQQFLRVRVPGEDEVLNFRFYSPRVMSTYLQTVPRKDRAAFMGPAQKVLIWDPESGQWWRWQSEVSAPKLRRVSETEMAAFSRLSMQVFEERTLTFIAEHFPQQSKARGKERMLALIRRGIADARAYGITSERDVTKYISIMVSVGEGFDADPRHGWARRILEARRRDAGERIDEITERFIKLEQGSGAEKGSRQ